MMYRIWCVAYWGGFNGAKLIAVPYKILGVALHVGESMPLILPRLKRDAQLFSIGLNRQLHQAMLKLIKNAKLNICVSTRTYGVKLPAYLATVGTRFNSVNFVTIGIR